jgi:hypothetical protein
VCNWRKWLATWERSGQREADGWLRGTSVRYRSAVGCYRGLRLENLFSPYLAASDCRLGSTFCDRILAPLAGPADLCGLLFPNLPVERTVAGGRLNRLLADEVL